MGKEKVGKSKGQRNEGGGGKKKSSANGALSDPRFAAALTDPRFQRFPKSHRTVDIDERFAGMFEDKDFQVKSAVDKRGRSLGKRKQREDMQKYYRLPKLEEQQGGKDVKVKAKAGTVAKTSLEGKGSGRKRSQGASKRVPAAAEPSSEESSDEEDPEQVAADRWAKARGLAGPQGSSSDEGSSSGEEDMDVGAASEEEDIDMEEWGIGAMAGNPDEQVEEVEEETRRLAILDLDWSKVGAADIFAMLKSFLKKGQRLERVTVYPSDYGLERMAEEARFGPQGLAGKPSQRGPPVVAGAEAASSSSSEGDSSDAEEAPAGVPLEGSRLSKEQQAVLREAAEEEASDSEAEGEEDDSEDSEDGAEGNLRGIQDKAASSDGDEDEKVNRRRLQMYERSRLRYYYAIAECADVATAKHLYEECDGMEFEHSASLFDLRYVPDSQDFSARQVREEATSVPAGYKPPEVGIAAMLHTKPKLTWDADDDDRKRLLSRKVTKDQLRDDDFKAYLGSESEDEEQPDQSEAERYRRLLTGSGNGKAAGKEWGADDGEEGSEEEGDSDGGNAGARKGGNMELEVTFGGGLDDLTHRLQAKREEATNRKNDTVWQAYERRRREKRQLAKQRGKRPDSDDDRDGGDSAEEDPYFKHDDDAFDDPFFKDGPEDTHQAGGSGEVPREKAARKAARDAAKAEAERERQRRAQLELLLMDERDLKDASKIGLQAVEGVAEEKQPVKKSKKARLAAKKAAKQAKRGAASDEEDLGNGKSGPEFKVDIADKRFEALFTSPDFALDPTDPRYKPGEAAASIQRESAKRRSKKPGEVGGKRSQPARETADTTAAKGSTETGDKADNLNLLVASLKRKGALKGKQQAKRRKQPS